MSQRDNLIYVGHMIDNAHKAIDWEHPTFVELPSSPSPFSQEGRMGAGLKSLSRAERGI